MGCVHGLQAEGLRAALKVRITDEVLHGLRRMHAVIEVVHVLTCPALDTSP